MRESGKKQAVPRRRRADSFFGLHFDFHAGPDCKDVGARVSDRMVAGIIEAARPDYLQCDCKGHPGIASYPTKVGTPAPGFVRDPHTHVFDAIPAVERLTVRVRRPRRPRRVLRHPGGQPLPYQYSKGVAVVEVDRLELHDIIEVEGAWAGGQTKERA